MAGDWIKFELATMDKPEVLRIGRNLGISREAVTGFLIRFWGWVGDNSVDGVVDGVVDADVDVVLSLPGFAESLMGVGWLEYRPETRQLVIPNFARHNGESSKKRALKTRSQSKWRDKNVDAPLSQNCLPEKRREEKIKTGRKLPLPEDWVPKEKTAADLSREFGLRVPEDVDRYVAGFRDICASKGHLYIDFDAAFRNCVRQDWPKLRDSKVSAPIGPRKVQF
jgi:hypothetical protein